MGHPRKFLPAKCSKMGRPRKFFPAKYSKKKEVFSRKLFVYFTYFLRGGGDFSGIFSSRVKKIEKLYFWWVFFLKKYSSKRVRNGFFPRNILKSFDRESFFPRNILKSFERESFFPRNAKISRSGPTAKVSSRESFFLKKTSGSQKGSEPGRETIIFFYLA